MVGEQSEDSFRLVNVDRFGTKLSNPLESTEDKAEEDRLLDDSNINEYPNSKIEELEPRYQCIFGPDFPYQNSITSIVRRYDQLFSTL